MERVSKAMTYKKEIAKMNNVVAMVRTKRNELTNEFPSASVTFFHKQCGFSYDFIISYKLHIYKRRVLLVGLVMDHLEQFVSAPKVLYTNKMSLDLSSDLLITSLEFLMRLKPF
jgi:hypothetical protein